jgi:hypothetical protein
MIATRRTSSISIASGAGSSIEGEEGCEGSAIHAGVSQPDAEHIVLATNRSSA